AVDLLEALRRDRGVAGEERTPRRLEARARCGLVLLRHRVERGERLGPALEREQVLGDREAREHREAMVRELGEQALGDRERLLVAAELVERETLAVESIAAQVAILTGRGAHVGGEGGVPVAALGVRLGEVVEDARLGAAVRRQR